MVRGMHNSTVCLSSKMLRWAIDRCIAGMSSLLVLPTGAGKSLTFLLSAILLAQRGHGLTIVVSPLIALMQDQIRKLPIELPGELY